MNDKGWIKLHRKILTDEVFKNEKTFRIFVYILLKAESIEKEISIKDKTVRLVAGQFYFDKEEVSKDLNMKSSTVYYYLKKLEEMGSITVSSNNKFTVIKINSWAKYQSYSKQKRLFKPIKKGKILKLKID